MTVSFRQEDDILKVFHDNRYVGYVDTDNMLHMINKEGYAEPFRSVEDRSQIAGHVAAWNNARFGRKISEDIKNMTIEAMLLGLLILIPADKSDARIVKEAKKYVGMK